MSTDHKLSLAILLPRFGWRWIASLESSPGFDVGTARDAMLVGDQVAAMSVRILDGGHWLNEQGGHSVSKLGWVCHLG